MQKRRNSIANALELRLFCINPSVLDMIMQLHKNPAPTLSGETSTLVRWFHREQQIVWAFDNFLIVMWNRIKWWAASTMADKVPPDQFIDTTFEFLMNGLDR